MFRATLLSSACLAAVLVVAGFFGQFIRVFDTIALAQPLLGGLCLIGALATRSRVPRFGLMALGFVALAASVRFFMPQDPGQDLRVYSKNLWFGNAEISPIVADIKTANVDTVFLQEISDRNRHILEQLKTRFPYQHLCRFSGWYGIAVVSRHPFDGTPICSTSRAMAAAPIKINGSRVWLVSAHIPWPWPTDSVKNEQAAHDLLAQLNGSVVIAGDFNSFPWTSRVRTIATLSHTKLAGPIHPTLTFRQIPLPLDFALSPGGGAVKVRPHLGSDHAGIVADLALTVR